MWDLTSAVAFIQEAAPKAKEYGFFLALAGGVLLKGSSLHDLDIVAIPRSDEERVFADEMCEHVFSGWKLKKQKFFTDRVVLTYQQEERLIDLTLIVVVE